MKPMPICFFGRETLTAHLVERVNGLIQHCPRLLAVVGASGSGKSSVVRAGLTVTLKRLGRDTRVFTPTAQPLKILEANPARPNANHADILLIVDQFEEVFTLCRDETMRGAFIEKLIDLADTPNERTSVVLVLRADFYSHCAQYPLLRQAIAAQQEFIGQMTQEELRRAIDEPAKQSHWEFEPGLVDLILHDIGADAAHDQEPGALPLLSHALLSTWEHRRGRTFTLEGYRASGGVHGAIAETAESVFTDQFDQTQQGFARDIFLRLTELGEGTEDTRRRAALTELVPNAGQAAQLRAVLNTLADARLVSLGGDSVEVAHEALIREWSRLREWLNQDREGLRLHRRLTDAAQAWEKSNRDESELYRGARLAQALDWAQSRGNELNAQERDFLDASQHAQMRAEEEREAQRQRELVAARKLAQAERRRANILRWSAIGSTILLVVMIGLALFASSQRDTAEKARADAEYQHQIAFARELSVNAISNLSVDPERSILLALQAVSVSSAGGKSVLREAEEALHRAVGTFRVQLTLHGHAGPVYGVAYSPDGTRIATASNDKTAKIWDAVTGKELLTLSGHTNRVLDVAFSPDGIQLVTGSGDQTAKVWDATTGKELLALVGHADTVWGVAFSPDGKRIATSSGVVNADSKDRTAKVWDAVTGKELLTLTGHKGGVIAVTFSPDGKYLATASSDSTAKVWDGSTGKELLTLTGHTREVRSVAFSPDDRRLATGSIDGTLKLWDAASGQLLFTLTGAVGFVRSVTFSPDGTRLVTSSTDGAVQVWDAATGTLLQSLVGHTAGVWRVSFSPDGTRLATSSDDNTVRVWDVSPAGNREWLTLDTHNTRLFGLDYSADGRRLATAGADKTAKIWDALTGKELLTLSGHTDELRSAGFSPDGSRLVTTSNDQTAKLWDAVTGKELLTLPTLADRYTNGPNAVFSPDGQRIATSGAGGTAQVWDAMTGQQLITLSGHSRQVLRVAFNSDGHRIATASLDTTAKVWDASTGQELLTLSGHSAGLYDVTFSPDGHRIATGSVDGTAKVWDATTGKELFTLSGHIAAIIVMAFSPDGTRLATGSSDATVKVWNVSLERKEGEQPLTLYGSTRSVNGIAFTPDGKRLATTGGDGTVRVYALPLEDIVAIAKSRVTRALTTDECQKFLHADRCP